MYTVYGKDGITWKDIWIFVLAAQQDCGGGPECFTYANSKPTKIPEFAVYLKPCLHGTFKPVQNPD